MSLDRVLEDYEEALIDYITVKINDENSRRRITLRADLERARRALHSALVTSAAETACNVIDSRNGRGP